MVNYLGARVNLFGNQYLRADRKFWISEEAIIDLKTGGVSSLLLNPKQAQFSLKHSSLLILFNN